MDEKLVKQLAEHRARKDHLKQISIQNGESYKFRKAIMAEEANHVKAMQAAVNHLRKATLARWFDEGFSGIEIAEALDITTARVSQLKKEILESTVEKEPTSG